MPERYRMTIDGTGCKAQTLNQCSVFMTQLVNTLNTIEVGRIQVNVIPKTLINSTGELAAPGVTIMVEYLESGAGLRTWPEEAEASLDVFSCKVFDSHAIFKAFKAFFNPKDWVWKGL